MSEKYFNVLSPDGFAITFDAFASRGEALNYIPGWCKQYERQGYYSSNDGRISLEDLPDALSIVEGDFIF
jgi:hypothetical protein